MHEGEPYGHLTVSGKALSARQLASVLGDSERDITKWLGELEENSVLSRTDDGVIFSRRMIKDKEREDRNKENGKAGGNPNLKKSVNLQDNGEDKAQKPEARRQKPSQDSSFQSQGHLPSGTEDEDEPRHSADLRPNFQYVAGGAKKFTGLGERERGHKPPAKADQSMVEHLTGHCGMDAGQAWALVMAARDPESEDHTDAARTCERESRKHKLGWFHAENAA